MWDHIKDQVQKGNFEATYKIFCYTDDIFFLLKKQNRTEYKKLSKISVSTVYLYAKIIES